MADDARIEAAIGGAERFVNAWHGRPMRERLSEIADATGEDERADVYGTGERIQRLEGRIAEILGAEAAVFMPSGTMAQQIALRIWSDRRGTRTVAFHPTCHLEIHEQKGYQLLHGLHGRLVGDPNSLITLGDLEGIHEPVAALLLELPQREIGGLLPAWHDLVAQTGWARERGIALHLDGARLWEAGPFYERGHAEIAGLFDSVYVSFYKDLDALAGAALAGDAELVAEARVWQRRHGGNLVTMHPFVVSAELSLDQRLERIPRVRGARPRPGGRTGLGRGHRGRARPSPDADVPHPPARRPRAPCRRSPGGRGGAEGVPVRRSRSHHVALRAAPRGDGRRRHASARPGRGGGALQRGADAGEPAVMAMPCRAGAASVKRSPCAAPDPAFPPPGPRSTNAAATARPAPTSGPATYTQ